MGHWRSVNRGKTDEDGWRWLDSAVYEVVSHLKKPQIIPPRHRKNTDFGGKGSRTPFFMTLYDYMMHEAPLIFQATIFLRLLVTKSWNVLKILDDLKFGNLSSGIPFTYRETDVVNKTLHLPVVLWLKNGSKGIMVYGICIYLWVMSHELSIWISTSNCSGIMQMVSSALSISQEMSVTIRF